MKPFTVYFAANGVWVHEQGKRPFPFGWPLEFLSIIVANRQIDLDTATFKVIDGAYWA